VEQPLAETLRRLRAHVGEEDLNCRELAADTALPEDVVQALLNGEEPPETTIEERVCTRIKTVRDAHLARTEKRPSDLVAELVAATGISDVWARKLLNGQKMPNVPLLVALAKFFAVEGGQDFFTLPPADALNRVLQSRLERYEDPASDPLQALLQEWGVRATDLRSHGNLTPQQVRALLENVVKSVLPPGGDVTR
jgi:hypothetical protein